MGNYTDHERWQIALGIASAIGLGGWATGMNGSGLLPPFLYAVAAAFFLWGFAPAIGRIGQGSWAHTLLLTSRKKQDSAVVEPRLKNERMYLAIEPPKTDDYKVSIVGPTVLKSKVPFPNSLKWTESGRGFYRLVKGTPSLVELCDVKFSPPRPPYGATLDIRPGTVWADW